MKSFLITILVSLAFIQATAQVPGKVPSSWAKEIAHTVMTRYPSAFLSNRGATRKAISLWDWISCGALPETESIMIT